MFCRRFFLRIILGNCETARISRQFRGFSAQAVKFFPGFSAAFLHHFWCKKLSNLTMWHVFELFWAILSTGASRTRHASA